MPRRTLQLGLAGCGHQLAEQKACIAGLGELQELWKQLFQHCGTILCRPMLGTRLQNAGGLVIQRQLCNSALDLHHSVS